jgi:hypothetical protein
MRMLIALTFLFFAEAVLAQEKPSGSNLDVRTVVTFKASDAAVQKLLPEGWEVSPPPVGPTKGHNLSLNLIDSTMAHDAEGKPVALFRGVVLAIPVKKKGSETGAAMVVFGLVAPGSAPGAYGNYVPAKVSVDRKVRTDADGKSVVEESWDSKSDDGDAIAVALEYERGAATKGKVEAKVHAGAKPDFFRIYRVDIVSDVARSTATNVDRVKRFSIKPSGKMAPLFEGAELISITSIPSYSRQVFLPGT